MEQSTLADISVEEGGGGATSTGEPPGSDPRTTFPYPDTRAIIENMETDEETPVEFDDLHSGHESSGRQKYVPCPLCGEFSETVYACSECGKLFDGEKTHGTRDTAVE